MTEPMLKRGTAKKRNYSKAEKFTALKKLEANDFNVQKTSKETGISSHSLASWRNEFGDKVFGKQPRADIAIRVINIEALLRIVRLDLQKRKEELAYKALDILDDCLLDPKKAQKLTPSILLEIIKLPPIVANQPSGVDAFTNAINELAHFEIEKEQRKNYLERKS